MTKEQQAEIADQADNAVQGAPEEGGRPEGQNHPDGAAEAPETSPEQLTALLEDARSKADENWDQLLRTRAELENLKRRHANELEKAHKFALDSFVRELLQVRDSLELGHDAAQDAAADIHKLREGTDRKSVV